MEGFFEAHPEFAWQKPILHDMKAGPWTVIVAGAKARGHGDGGGGEVAFFAFSKCKCKCQYRGLSTALRSGRDDGIKVGKRRRGKAPAWMLAPLFCG